MVVGFVNLGWSFVIKNNPQAERAGTFYAYSLWEWVMVLSIFFTIGWFGLAIPNDLNENVKSGEEIKLVDGKK